MIIYKITNQINNKQYVGQTVRSLTERFQEHARKNSVVSQAIKKYGIENFIIEQIDSAKTIEELNKKEILWIDKLNTMQPNGYNLCSGGGNTKGYAHKPKSRKLMSAHRKGKYTGKQNHFYKKKHSKETRKKMSEAWTEERKRQLADLSRERNMRNQAVKVRNLETKQVFNSIKEAAEYYGLKPTHITRVCRGKRKTTGGFHWEYVDKTIPSQADFKNQKV